MAGQQVYINGNTTNKPVSSLRPVMASTLTEAHAQQLHYGCSSLEMQQRKAQDGAGTEGTFPYSSRRFSHDTSRPRLWQKIVLTHDAECNQYSTEQQTAVHLQQKLF